MSKTDKTQNATQALAEPGQTGLKAERVQSVPVTGQTRLKAERIQLALQGLPGWRLQRGVHRIQRVYELPDAQQIARLLQYVAELAYNGGTVPELIVRKDTVTFSLPISSTGWIEEPLFELAKALDVRS